MATEMCHYTEMQYDVSVAFQILFCTACSYPEGASCAMLKHSTPAYG